MPTQITLTKEQEEEVVKNYLNKQKSNVITYSIIGASRVLGVSESTIHRLIKDGEIQKIIVGKSPRISNDEITKFLSNNHK